MNVEVEAKGFPVRAMMLKERKTLVLSDEEQTLLKERALVVMNHIKSKAYSNA